MTANWPTLTNCMPLARTIAASLDVLCEREWERQRNSLLYKINFSTLPGSTDSLTQFLSADDVQYQHNHNA